MNEYIGTGREASEGASIPFTDEECAPWIVTYSGMKINLIDPQCFMITLADIAHHLATTNRFCGALRQPYSVGQHSIYVRDIIAATYPNEYQFQLAALFHDAEETYMNDLSRPLKPIAGPAYAAACVRMRRKIFETFNIPLDLMDHPDIKEADDIALMVERRDYLAAHPDWPTLEMPEYPRLESLEWGEVEKKFNRLAEWLFDHADRYGP